MNTKYQPKHKTLNSQANKHLVDLLKQTRLNNGLTMRGVVANLAQPHSFVGKIENMSRRLDVIEFIDYCHAINADPVEILSRVVAQKGQLDNMMNGNNT